MSRQRQVYERIRAQLASVKMVNLEPATVEALSDAIEELDDLIVEDIRVEQWVKDAMGEQPSMPETFDAERFAADFFNVPTMAVVS